MLTSTFLKEKPVRALAALAKKDREWYASMLSKEIDCTYPHLINTLTFFEEAGLVKREGRGRINVITLTETGEDLAHDLEGLLRRLERLDAKGPEKTEAKKAEETAEEPGPKEKRK